MTPVFANSAFVSAPERLVVRSGGRHPLRFKVRYGVHQHPTAGLVLIDTGYGPRVTEGAGRSLPLRIYASLLRPRLIEEHQPTRVLDRLGASTADVAAIVLTHFHADHVAALHLFPKARIYAKATVHARVEARSRFSNLRHGVFDELLPQDLSSRIVDIDKLSVKPAPNGLGEGADLFADGETLAVNLPGHAEGHFGICFAAQPVPLLYAVDTQWCAAALDPGKAPGLPAALVASDRRALAASSRRVAAFREQGGDVLLCHDPSDSPYDLPEASE
ncbi:MBL fold metallo-hydrolase [Roseibium sp.]|uniref:MBL fold metallo-hydrolase n=1 Tax=Roseibium sp. TaxID=1936156 RepID=UPI003513700A